MHGSGIDHIAETQLAYASQALHKRMLQHIVGQFVRNTEKTEDRIVDDFAFVGHILLGDSHKIFRHIGLEVYFLLRNGMDELQNPCMQAKTIDR